MSLLSRPVIRMPELGQGEWLNTPSSLTRESLRGQTLLIDFWDYACVNCIRTLPYVAEWDRRYRQHGLTVIGIHTPEFKFAQQRTQVEAAAAEFNLTYPILLDNEYATWDAFANKAWPTKYLIDAKGYIRYQRRGEGGYLDTERAIQQLLLSQNPAAVLPAPMPPLREEDAPGAACYRATPELHAGYAGGLFGGALGNPEGYHTAGPMVYRLPAAAEREEGVFYADGIWQARAESLAFAGQAGGRILLRYSAAGVNAVLSPSGDPVELRLNLRPSLADPLVEIRLDGRPLPPKIAGEDVYFEDSRALVRITRPRMVHLIQHITFESHELELIFHAKGLALYTFTFTSCITPKEGSKK